MTEPSVPGQLPAGATPEGDGIAVGDGPVQVDIYIDFLCPYCRQFELNAADTLAALISEHRATLVAQRIVGRLGLQFGRRGKDRGTVALAAPASDLHTLPVSIVADLLRWRGFDVVELGVREDGRQQIAGSRSHGFWYGTHCSLTYYCRGVSARIARADPADKRAYVGRHSPGPVSQRED